jgi:hypothetical protein
VRAGLSGPAVKLTATATGLPLVGSTVFWKVMVVAEAVTQRAVGTVVVRHSRPLASTVQVNFSEAWAR